MCKKIRTGLLTFAGVAVLSLSGAASNAAEQVDPTAKEAARNLAIGVCAACHGPEGRSTDPAIPRLAGQQRAYIEVQLKAFRVQSRGDPDAHDYMWGVASTLSDSVSAGLAEYFSSRTPVAGKAADPALAAKGKQLYEQGSSDRNVLACSGCHGANAEGKLVFPRLAGQHGQYLSKQMHMLRVRLRDSPVMHGVIKQLTDEEMTELASYLESR